MSEFTVDRKQLTTASGSFETLATKAGEIAAALEAVPLTQPDFGRVPWLQTRVWEAYDEHTTACNDSLTELTDALTNVSGGLDATATAYRGMDEAAEEAATYITQNLEVGPE